MAATQWDFWKQALAWVEAGRPKASRPVFREGQFESGCYALERDKREGARATYALPVVIYYRPNGEWYGRVGTEEISEDDARKIWTQIADEPRTKAACDEALATGVWPDTTPAKAPEKPAGSNLPDDPFKQFMAEVTDYAEQAKAFCAKPDKTDKTRADIARNMQARLLEMKRSADVMFKAEKDPVLKQAREIDDKYRFRETLLVEWASRLRVIYENWMRAEDARIAAETEKKRKEQEAIRLAAEETARQLQAQQDAERAKMQEDDPVKFYTEPAPEPIMPAYIPEFPIEAPKVRVGGGTGRAAGLKRVPVGEIENIDLVFAHYRTSEKVRAVLQQLVDAQVRATKFETVIPGVVIKEDKRAA